MQGTGDVVGKLMADNDGLRAEDAHLRAEVSRLATANMSRGRELTELRAELDAARATIARQAAVVAAAREVMLLARTDGFVHVNSARMDDLMDALDAAPAGTTAEGG